ncbi:Eukaryotic translation initiation factor 2C [Apophysomyces sp. BC1015]|nr:Eukaryotic translation initiation factor 2C [Apophysomyces sp. BC1015]
MALNLTEFVLRGKPGTVGRPVRFRANFFEVTSFPTQNIIHYDVTIHPNDLPPPLNRKVWQAFETMESQGVLRDTKAVFDGKQNAFAAKTLPLGPDHLKVFEVKLHESDVKRKVEDFKIHIKKVGEVNMEELRLFLLGKAAINNNCLTAITVMDILIHHWPKMNYSTKGSSFYLPNDKRSLGGGVEIWQGYYQSARPTVGKLMVNFDVSATAYYESGPLPELVARFLGRRSVDELRSGLSDRDRTKIGKFLKDLRIVCIHRGEKQPKFKINKVTPSSADRTMFKDDAGNEQSVAAYFSKQYNKRLAYPFLPCLVVKRDIFLPMEVCHIIPGQRYMKKLDANQTSEVIKFTCQKPNVRANKINQGLQLLNYKNPHMQEFNMTVKPEMAMINGRVLPLPQLSVNPASKDGTFTPNNGVWNMLGKKVAQGASLGSWSVVNFNNRGSPDAINKFIRMMVQTFTELGLNVVNREPPVMNGDPQGNIDRTLKQAWLTAGNAAKANPQLIVCIMPGLITDLYAEIKRISDTVIGIPTQCLQYKHVMQAKHQYCANVCLKVNMKLGGMNMFLPPAQIPFISQKPTIVFGADVTHPGIGDHSRPSIAALVGSMDARASRYASAIRVQANRTEIIADLANMVKELLKSFYQQCGQKPERILFYRDGVSEGQFKTVKKAEIEAIEAACLSLEKTYKPKITFVVVQKRHHARFFPLSERDADRSGNCQPGTSHAGLQGTSRPTHYHVLKDDNGFTSDSLQELTYRLCYIYGRATRSVSLVPPAYYADLVAGRARYHRRGENWSDIEATSESMDSEQHMASFSVVKPELQKAPDYYRVLDISKDASNEEIRRAYIRRSRVCHPDKFVPPYARATESFQLLSLAYETLSNPSSKLMYDLSKQKGSVPFVAGDDENPNDTLQRVLHQLFIEMMEGEFSTMRVFFNGLNETNPGMQVSEDAIIHIELAFRKMRQLFLSTHQYYKVIQFELMRLYELQHELRDLSYFNVWRRMQLSITICKVLLQLPIMINAESKEKQHTHQDGILGVRVESALQLVIGLLEKGERYVTSW